MIYVDMDGVLADFVAGIDSIILSGYDESQYRNDPAYRSMMWEAVADHTDAGGRLWGDLPLMEDAKVLWEFVCPHRHEILSATGEPAYGADTQKREWAIEHFGADVRVNLVSRSEEKADYVTSLRDILIDDQPKSIDPWIAAGGIGILHTSADNTINELKKLGYT